MRGVHLPGGARNVQSCHSLVQGGSQLHERLACPVRGIWCSHIWPLQTASLGAAHTTCSTGISPSCTQLGHRINRRPGFCLCSRPEAARAWPRLLHISGQGGEARHVLWGQQMQGRGHPGSFHSLGNLGSALLSVSLESSLCSEGWGSIRDFPWAPKSPKGQGEAEEQKWELCATLL